MPYISQLDRKELERAGAWDAGTLTYTITQACTAYIDRVGPCFASMAEVVAALECAKLEFYRRVVAPYEDRKCTLNGDVYE